MLESFEGNTFKYEKLSPEEQKSRGILGRLIGIIADGKSPTRNGRMYPQGLWENVFNNPIMQEKIKNRCLFGELGHPVDRTETDIEKIAICLAEQPKIGDDGKLYGVFDILDSPNGRILKSLCDYGCTIGVSSRGSGDTYVNNMGQEIVDENSYECEGWDAVILPAVKEARMKLVTESLENKSLKQVLTESLNNASDKDRKIMEESLNDLGLDLTEKEIESDINNTELAEEVLDEADIWNIYMAIKDEDGKVVTTNRNLGSCFKYLLKEKGKQLYGYYTREKNRDFQDETLLIYTITDENKVDSLYPGGSSYYEAGLNIYIDGKWQPRKIKAEDIKQAVRDGKSVIVSRGKRLTTESLEDIFDNDLEVILNENSVGYINSDELIEALKEGKLEIDLTEELTTDELQKTNQLIKEAGFNNIDELKSALDKLNSQTESSNIEEPISGAVENNEAVVEELQKTIKQNLELSKKVRDLQEQLSVCYTKESEVNVKLESQNNMISNLSKNSKKLKEALSENKALSEKVNKLTEALNKEKRDNSKKSLSESLNQNKLTESIAAKNKEISTLNESLTKLTEDINSYKQKVNKLNEDLATVKKDSQLKQNEYSKKLNESLKLNDKYKALATQSVEKYIGVKANVLGVSSNEIKNRLPESYTFRDIDKACDNLQDFKINLNRLPFDTENMTMRFTPSMNESIMPRVTNDADDISEFEILLANNLK